MTAGEIHDVTDEELRALVPVAHWADVGLEPSSFAPAGVAHQVAGERVVVSDLLPRAMIWARPRPPAKRDGRRGTRRAWKRANPPGLRPEGARLGPYRMGGVVICSPEQFEALADALRVEGDANQRGN